MQVEQIPLIRLRANKGGGGQYQHHCARKYILKFKLSIFEHYEVEGQQRWWWGISTTLCRKVQPSGEAHWRKVNCGEKSTLEEGGEEGETKEKLFVCPVATTLLLIHHLNIQFFFSVNKMNFKTR